MDPVSLNQFLLLTTWFAFAALIFLLALIARFYEKSSGAKTYFRLYIFPIGGYGLSVTRYVSVGQWGGDYIADVSMFLTGICLITLCFWLYQKMTE